jgi:hypothetical protein
MMFTYPSGAAVSGLLQNAYSFGCGTFVIREKIFGRGQMCSDPAAQIFVVDDEPVIAFTLAAILQMNGYSAKFYPSPLEALTAARAESSRPTPFGCK